MFEDNFNEPNFNSGYDSYGSYDSESGGKKDIKKFLPIIIIVIVIIVILAFVLIFFNSQRTITFNISEFGGGSVSDATLTVRSLTGEVIYGPEQGNSHTITLMTGEYTYSVLSLSHKSKRDVYMTVDTEKTEENIVLERDVRANLQTIQTVEKIFYGQEVTGKIIISEPESDLVNQEISWSDSEGILKITLNPSKITLNQGGAKTVDYTIEVDSNPKASTETKITFGLKGTNVKTEAIKITVNPTIPASDFVEKKGEKNKLISDESLVAGEEKIIQLSFENKNKKIDVENIRVSILPDLEYENTDWSIILTNNGLIDKIEKGKTGILQLRLNSPITSNVGDDFKGKLVVEADSLEEKKEYIVLFKVDKATFAKLKLNKNSFKIDCEPDCKLLNTAVEGLTIENTGNTTVSDVKIEVDTTRSPICENWFTINIDYIESIASKEKKTIDIDIVPLFINETKETPCYLKFTYTDPTKTERQVFVSDPPLRIKTKYDPPD